MSYTYKGQSIFATGVDTSCNSLTGYTINGTSAKFLKPFYQGTTNAAVTDLTAIVSMFKYNNSNQIDFCPRFIIHDVNGTNSIPSDVTKMFVVCIGGGGGGGGGGVRGSGNTGGGGGGGGGGALNAWIINFVSGQTTYSVTVGAGGTYGQPTNQSTIAEGANSSSGTAIKGANGTTGGDTIFTYNAVTYTSKGGAGGVGGTGDGSGVVGSGGAGGVVTTSPTPYENAAGAAGTGGSYDNSTPNIAGGVGGANGNGRGASTRILINNTLISIQPFEPYTNASDTDANYNDDRICYGDGGRGGRGEGAGWGWAGYSGLKGCVIVFFYY